MRAEPVQEKIVLSKEDYEYYQRRRRECNVYDPNQQSYGFKYRKKKPYFRK